MRTILTALVAAALAVPAFAGEAVSGKNYYVRDVQAWPTGEKSSYWRNTYKGVSEVHTGPLDSAPSLCVGGGFYGPGGSKGEGICIFGEGDDTWVMKWLHEGTSGTWEIESGSGKWAGITGGGTYESSQIGSNGVSAWEGEVTLP